MKLKKDFELKNIAGSFVVFPVGEKAVDFNGMLTLNETGAFLWEKLTVGADKDGLVHSLCEEYRVDEKTAAEDIDVFIQKLTDIGCLDLQ